MSTTTELTWTKSSYSGSSGDNCVEVAASPTTIHIRDSKHPHGPALSVASDSWAAFVTFAAGRAV
ncbi:DUF397 domain-containing protein [Streptomyces sp. NPDC017056]|uniref:DUF397 domain-containing protein n=1 Tax=Streptomyces sp. NPDC017056 TaxID=3364973 RepID=UPI00378FE04C